MEKRYRILSWVCNGKGLACIALLLLLLLLWGAASAFSFGGWYPFQSWSIRLCMTMILLLAMVLLVRGMSLSVVWLALACMLVWYAGPFLKIAHWWPLASAGVRWLMMIGMTGGWGLLQLRRRRRELGYPPARWLTWLSGTERAPAMAQDSMRSSCIHQTDKMLRRASRRLSWSARLRDCLRGQYQMPWYLVLGPEGSGKTSAIRHASLASLSEMPAPDVTATGVRVWVAQDNVLMECQGIDILQAEQGLLPLLKKRRPRMPLNGVILMVSLPDLLDQQRSAAIAAACRKRMLEMRKTLGIRFPVYLVLTKMDYVQGFSAYFASLSEVERQQPWGVTFDYCQGKGAALQQHWQAQLQQAFSQLWARLDHGVAARMDEEYDARIRKDAAVLPEEFRHLEQALVTFIEQGFAEAPCGAGISYMSLRGVYFSSVLQEGKTIPVDEETLFRRSIPASCGYDPVLVRQGHMFRGYFLREVLEKVILPEPFLAGLNTFRRIRRRLLWGSLQVTVVAATILLIHATGVSFRNNTLYLDNLDTQLVALEKQAAVYREDPQDTQLPLIMQALHELPVSDHAGLEGSALPYRYGLFMVPDAVRASEAAYLDLYSKLFLPKLRQKMTLALETAVAQGDAVQAYDALHVYLMLFEKQQFRPEVMRTWILEHWDTAGRKTQEDALIAVHLDRLTRSGKWYRPVTGRNDALIGRARHLIGSRPASVRVYKRMRDDMMADSPPSLTLDKIIGPVAGRVLVMDDDQLQAGIPGLFTAEGYRQVYQEQARDILQRLSIEESFVTGNERHGYDEALAASVHRDYLEEYAAWWTAFLHHVRPVHANTGDSLAGNMYVADALASEDSPLEKLVNIAVTNTSLSTPAGAGSVMDKLAGWLPSMLAKPAPDVYLKGYAAVRKREKDIVDDHFALLHQVAANQPAKRGQHGPMALDAVFALLHDYSEALRVASEHLSAGKFPEDNEVLQRIRLLAFAQPAPLQQVLAGLSGDAGHHLQQAAGNIMSQQIRGELAQQCRQLTQGKYPFVAGGADIDLRDFVHLFAKEGVLDQFFSEHLAQYVDTTVHPWKYKENSVMAGAPELQMFEHAARIRHVFFQGEGQQVPLWKTAFRVVEMDPAITQMTMDMDGQRMRYVHGPVESVPISWPGPRGGNMASVTVLPGQQQETDAQMMSGPWAVLRLLEKAHLTRLAQHDSVLATFMFGQRSLVLEWQTGQDDPLSLLRTFRCTDAPVTEAA